MGQPRPVCDVKRTWLDAALLSLTLDWLRPADGRDPTLSATGLEDPRSPGIWRDAGRRDHHRTVGAGYGKRRGHGDRGKSACGSVQPQWSCDHRSLYLRVLG